MRAPKSRTNGELQPRHGGESREPRPRDNASATTRYVIRVGDVAPRQREAGVAVQREVRFLPLGAHQSQDPTQLRPLGHAQGQQVRPASGNAGARQSAGERAQLRPPRRIQLARRLTEPDQVGVEPAPSRWIARRCGLRVAPSGSGGGHQRQQPLALVVGEPQPIRQPPRPAPPSRAAAARRGAAADRRRARASRRASAGQRHGPGTTRASTPAVRHQRQRAAGARPAPGSATAPAGPARPTGRRCRPRARRRPPAPPASGAPRPKRAWKRKKRRMRR